MTETRKLLDDGTVNIVTETTIPQYEARLTKSAFIANNNAEMDLQCIKDNDAYIHVPYGSYDSLNTEEGFEPEGLSAEEDFNAFKKHIEEAHPKQTLAYYYLMAYVHGDTKFYLSEDCSRVCQFDSGCVGFIAIRKDNLGPDYDDNNITKILTDCWNGYYTAYEIYDNLEQSVVDSYEIGGSFENEKIHRDAIEALAKTYGVSFDGVEIDYK